MASSNGAEPEVTGRRRRHASEGRVGDEHLAALLSVADAASMAFLVLEEAARSARADLEAVLRSVRAIDQQERAGRRAAHALDEAGARAAEHLRTVDRLTEAASRSVGSALAESGATSDDATLEQLDAWADLSRRESDGLHHFLRGRWGLADVLESLTDLSETEAWRLQQVIEQRSLLLTTLTDVLSQQVATARSITDARQAH